MGRGLEDYDKLTLATIGGGALEEKFQHELDRVLKNIADPNAADGKREIVLKVVFCPNAKSSTAELVISAASKIQADMPFDSMVYLGREGAQHVAWEHNPEQFSLPMAEPLSEVKTTIGGMK